MDEVSTQRLTIKPAYLIGYKIGRDGGVEYARVDGEKLKEGNFERRSWTTTRTVPDVAELKKADGVASECRRLLNQVGYRTSFGFIVPKDREQDYDEAIKEIRAKLASANPLFMSCRLSANFVRAEILTSDAEAAQAVMAEIGSFMATLQEAIKSCDAKKIRETLATVKGIDTLLPGMQSQAIKSAVSAARKAAKLIVREVEKKGSSIERVKAELDLSAIDAARAMFLEIDPGIETDDAPAQPMDAQRPELEPVGTE